MAQHHDQPAPHTPREAHRGAQNESLSEVQVRAVAKLARLALSDDEVRDAQQRLTGVLSLMQRLQMANLGTTEPLRHVSDATNHLSADTPGQTLPPSTIEQLAPDSWEGYVRVPKVLGEGGGA